MKKASAIALAFFMLHCIKSKAQIYFDNLYGDSSNIEGIAPDGTINVANGYLTFGWSYINYRPHLFIVDFNGVVLSEHYLPQADTVNRLTQNVIEIGDTIFAGVTSVKNLNLDVDVQGDYGLLLFGLSGYQIWEKTYGDTDKKDIPQRMVRTFEGGYLITGGSEFSSGTNQTGDSFAVCTDSLGNVRWQKYYGGSNWDASTSAFQTPDSGFLLLGWTRSYGAGQKDWYLVKTDSLGNQEWQKTYGDANNQSGSCIIASNDGNYVMCGGAGNGAARMIKIDLSGTVIWQFDYAHPNGTGSNYLFKVIELEDGSLIATGLSNNTSQSDAGWLIKTDADGIELWQRRYNKNNNTDLFYSVLLANDGGFLLSGQARNAETNSQDAWLLKVDSIGCPYPNCLVGVDEVEKSRVVVDVWPNPTASFLNIEWQRTERAKISLFDLSGREVISLNGGLATIEQIDVSQLPNGLYVLKLVQGSSVVSLKIVVE